MWLKPQFLSLFLLFIFFKGQTQDLEIGPIVGGTYYLGDLNPSRQFLLTSPAFGVVGRMNFDDRWVFRFHYLRGHIEGDDSVSNFLPSRGLDFQSDIREIATLIEFNFFDYYTGSKINYFSPYLIAGPGIYLFNPFRDTIELAVNQPEQDYKSSTIGLTFIIGFGFKYSLSKKVGVAAEWGLRKTFTDYLDGVSKTYSGNSGSDPTNSHTTGMQRGNSQTKDWYSFAGITLTYRFSLSQKTTCSGFEYSQ